MTTQRERMLAGQLYDPNDPELAELHLQAVERCQALSRLSPRDESGRRRLFEQMFAAGGETVNVQPPFFCDYGIHISLGQRVFFNANCVVLDVCPVRIGSFTMFGPAVQIYTATHPLEAGLRRQLEFARPVSIGDDVWVGGGAIILPGVTIGSRTIIGAGSVVSRDIPDDVIAAGNPCRVLRPVPTPE